MGVTNISSNQSDMFTEQIKKWWDYNNGSNAFTGLLMAIIRVQEPAMWNVFCKTVLCQKSDLSKEKTPKPTQLQFLMSSLNIELVHIILTAVSSKTVGTTKSKDFRNYHEYDFSSKNEFTLDCIEIENRRDWDFEDIE